MQSGRTAKLGLRSGSESECNLPATGSGIWTTLRALRQPGHPRDRSAPDMTHPDEPRTGLDLCLIGPKWRSALG